MSPLLGTPSGRRSAETSPAALSGSESEVSPRRSRANSGGTSTPTQRKGGFTKGGNFRMLPFGTESSSRAAGAYFADPDEGDSISVTDIEVEMSDEEEDEKMTKKEKM